MTINLPPPPTHQPQLQAQTQPQPAKARQVQQAPGHLPVIDKNQSAMDQISLLDIDQINEHEHEIIMLRIEMSDNDLIEAAIDWVDPTAGNQPLYFADNLASGSGDDVKRLAHSARWIIGNGPLAFPQEQLVDITLQCHCLEDFARYQGVGQLRIDTELQSGSLIFDKLIADDRRSAQGELLFTLTPNDGLIDDLTAALSLGLTRDDVEAWDDWMVRLLMAAPQGKTPTTGAFYNHNKHELGALIGHFFAIPPVTTD